MAERLARRLWMACLLGFGLGLGFGVVPSAAAVTTVRDDSGRSQTFDKPVQRIVSVLPALTEMVCHLGHCERLVGVDRYASWPERVNTLPRVGGGLDPSIEAIVALRPDLVLMAGSSRGGERLRALGIPVLSLEPRTHADVQRILATLGTVLGVADPDRAWREMELGLDAVAREVPVQARGWRVYFEVNEAPFAASPSSFIGQTLSRLGLGNVVPASLGPFPRINPEMVVRTDPDLVMMGERDGLISRPGWRQLRAVRSGRVCVFTAAEADVLVRPGPRMVEAAQLMARCVARHAGPAAATGRS